MSQEDEELKLPPGFILKDDKLEQVNVTGRRLARKPQKRKGRPKKIGPKRTAYYYGKFTKIAAKFKTVSLLESDYTRLAELMKFYKVPSRPRMVAKLVQDAFDKAYEESLTLMRIEQRRERERNALRPNNPSWPDDNDKV